MADFPETNEEFNSLLAKLSFNKAMQSLAITMATQEAVADFISHSNEESKEEVTKRINKRAREILSSLCTSEGNLYGIDPKIFDPSL